MKLNQLRYLVELEKYETISKTAEKMFISQPSLSIAIKDLEAELGFEVIRRTGKGIVFTSRGERVLQHCKTIMNEVEQILAMNEYIDCSSVGHLSVGCVPYIVNSVVLDTLMELKMAYPSLQVSLKELNSYDALELVYQRELDLSVIMISNIEADSFKTELENKHLIFTKLFDDRMFIWCGRSNPLYTRSEVSMKEALQYSFVVYRDVLNAFNRNKLLSYNDKLDFVSVDDKDGVRKYLTKFRAVTVMPMCTVWEDHSYYEKQFIKPLEITDFDWTVKLGIIYAEDELLSLEAKQFMQMLVGRFQNKI